MLEINNVIKHYGNTTALNDVTLRIPTGSCYGLVGPNGAGKSTLIKIIVSVIRHFEGKVHIEDSVLNQDIKRKIGYVPQAICLEESATAIGNLYFFGKLYGLKRKVLQQRAKDVLEQIGLLERSTEKVLTFSGGMKRRLNIGCALMHNPDILIMDEPTVGIDPQSRRYIFQMIEGLKKAGRTVIYASHYMEEVEQLCDFVAFIDHGIIIEQNTIEELLKQYATPSIYMKGNNIPAEQVKQYGAISVKKGGFLLTTDAPLEAMEGIISYCRYHHIDLERLELVQPRLEDVFFSLTGNQLRD